MIFRVPFEGKCTKYPLPYRVFVFVLAASAALAKPVGSSERLLANGHSGNESRLNRNQGLGQPLQTSSDETAVLQESKPLVTRAGAWHTWNDVLHLKPGQEKRPLVLTFINGADGRAKFTDLRVELGRKPFATLKDFAGADNLPLNLTGALQPGNTHLTVQGFGPSGARLVWRLSTVRPFITAVKPIPIRTVDKVSVQGKNFPEQAGDMKVLIANKPVKILSMKNTQVDIEVPTKIPSGQHELTAIVDSIKSKPFKVLVKSHPEIERVDLLAAPPQHPLVISGKGFSSLAAHNIVKFGSVIAHVESATEDSIICLIPEMHFPQWYVPIKVITDGMPSREHITIHVDMRIVPNEGIPMH